MKVEPFKPSHLQQMALQPAQEYLRMYLVGGYAEFLAAASEVAQSIRIGSVVVACFGIAEEDRIGRVLWCFFAKTARRHLLRIVRYAQDFTENRAYPFLHSTVEASFEPGERLLRKLGFTFIQILPAHGPDGRDHLLFVKL